MLYYKYISVIALETYIYAHVLSLSELVTICVFPWLAFHYSFIKHVIRIIVMKMVIMIILMIMPLLVVVVVVLISVVSINESCT